MIDSASTSPAPEKDDKAIVTPAVGPVADKKDEATKAAPAAIADKK